MYIFCFCLGTLGLLDYDTVEINNLHRQVLHTEDTLNVTKVRSAAQQLKRFVLFNLLEFYLSIKVLLEFNLIEIHVRFRSG